LQLCELTKKKSACDLYTNFWRFWHVSNWVLVCLWKYLCNDLYITTRVFQVL